MSETTQPTQTPTPQPERFRYLFSEGFAGLLESLGASLLVTTYQAGKLMVVRARGGRVSTLLRSFEQPMGLAVRDDSIALGTRNQVWYLDNAPEIAPQLDPPGTHDACFVPRRSHVTSDIRSHEMGWMGQELVVLNTRFSCLCKLEANYSFTPIWKPAFVSELAAEDRCHLNGLAMDGDRPRFATALGATDTAQGWRENKASGGVLIDIESNQVISTGLAMPHSPRWHDGRLFVLDSGRGQLQVVDPDTGRRDVVAQLPGYCRGLSFLGRFAFVGLSKIRETSTFGGMPIEEQLSELRCGVFVVDLSTGQVVGCLEFESGCTELFAVEVLPGRRFPAVIGFEKETLNGVFIMPPQYFHDASPLDRLSL